MELSIRAAINPHPIDSKIFKILYKDIWKNVRLIDLSEKIGSSKQAVRYRLILLKKRGLVISDKRRWFLTETGRLLFENFSKKKTELPKFQEIDGVKQFTNFMEGLVSASLDNTIYAIENVDYRSLSTKEREHWFRSDKIMDDMFLKYKKIFRLVSNADALKMFLESQRFVGVEVDEGRREIYKVVPDDVIRLPYQKACTTVVIGDCVCNIYFKQDRMLYIKDMEYASLVKKFYGLAELYGRQVDLNAELRRMKAVQVL